MRVNLTRSSHKIHGVYYLAIFTLLIAVAMLVNGCNSADKTADDHVKPAQPMPTPPPDDTLGDTPIVISGGSIHLDFNKRMFNLCTDPQNLPPTPCPSPSPATDKVYWAKATITSAFIYNDNDNNTSQPLEVTRVANKSTITVKGTNNAGLDDIVITSIEPANPANRIVTIEFDEGKNAPRRIGSRRRTNRTTKFENVIVIDNQGNRKEYKNEAGYPNNKKLTLEIQ